MRGSCDLDSSAVHGVVTQAGWAYAMQYSAKGFHVAGGRPSAGSTIGSRPPGAIISARVGSPFEPENVRLNETWAWTEKKKRLTSTEMNPDATHFPVLAA